MSGAEPTEVERTPGRVAAAASEVTATIPSLSAGRAEAHRAEMSVAAPTPAAAAAAALGSGKGEREPAAPTLLAASAGESPRADADGEPDDLPTPVASTRSFTMPKIVRRIAVPAATAATSELDSSAELDLPQLAAMTSLPPAIETVVAPPRSPGSTRPDDVDLDLDDIHGEPSEPPIAPAPATPSEVGTPSRSAARPSMRPRPRRLAPQVVQPPPPAIAYVGLVTLAAGVLGLWWFFFTRGPGLAAVEQVLPARTDMSRTTWSEGYLEAQRTRLDADRVP